MAASFEERRRAPENEGRLDRSDADATWRGEAAFGRLELGVRGDVIKDAAHQSEGSPDLRACLDAAASLVAGKSLREALRLSATDLVDFFDDFPDEALPSAIRAANLLEDCLIELSFQGQTPSEDLLCRCAKVPERVVREQIQIHGLRDVFAVRDACNAGSGCQSCLPIIESLIEEMHPDVASSKAARRELIDALVRDKLLKRLHPKARLTGIQEGDIFVSVPGGLENRKGQVEKLEKELLSRTGRPFRLMERNSPEQGG